MKIISKFSDYYDGLQSHDASNGVYERKTQELPVDWIGYGSECMGDEHYKLTTGLIGFCGKVYPYVKYAYYLKHGVKGQGFAYSYEDYVNVCNVIENIKVIRHRWMGECNLFNSFYSKIEIAKCWFDKDFETLIADIPKWRTSTTGRSPEYVKLGSVFYDHKVPYYALERATREERNYHGWIPQYKLTLNPRLLDYKFQNIFDSYTAYQEIEMFMNNQIVRPDDPYIEPVSDKLKAEAHGFDKHSFRKDKKVRKSKK